jgi:hypothetical protein
VERSLDVVRLATAGENRHADGDIDRRYPLKKIALVSAAMGGAALIAFGASGTFASFSDSQQLKTSAVSAGSLKISAEEAASTTVQGTNMAPGSTAVRVFKLTNSGAGVTATPTVQVLSIANMEDGCTSSSEEKSGDDCTNASAGDLASQLTMGYSAYAPNGDGTCPTPTTGFTNLGPLATTAPLGNSAITLGGGKSLCAAFQLTFAPGANNNWAQGDSFTAQIEFALQQVL